MLEAVAEEALSLLFNSSSHLVAAMSQYRLLIHSASQIVTVVNKGELVLRGPSMKDIAVLKSHPGYGYSIVVDK